MKTCVANTAPPFRCGEPGTVTVTEDHPAWSNWRGSFPASRTRYKACPTHAARRVADAAPGVSVVAR